VLQADEYAKITDLSTGIKRTVAGLDGVDGNGMVVWLDAMDEMEAPGVSRCPNLTREEYILVTEQDGEKRIEVGPQLYKPGPHQMLGRQMQAIKLTKEEYLVVEDKSTGVKRNEIGPQMFVPGPFDDYGSVQQCYNLAVNEFLRIKDENGVLRIERGEKRVVPGPLEEVLEEMVWVMEGKRRKQRMMKQQIAVNVDEHHAVLVRDTESGNLRQYCDHGLFMPGPYEQIVEVQEKIVLQEFERMAYKDETGKLVFVSGDSEMRNFFLPPFCEIVTQDWSIDLRKEHTETVSVWRFDVRPSYMQYEFSCRTVDNVELIVDVSFYWAIVDIQKMIMCTADAPGDICTHARSKIIQSVSNKTLMEFLRDFNEIIRKGAGVDAQPGAGVEEEKRIRGEELKAELEVELEEARAELDQCEEQLASASVPAYEMLDEIELLEYDEMSPKTKMGWLEKRCKQAKKKVQALEKQIKQHAVTCRAHDPFYGSRGVDLISVEVLKFSCSNKDTDHTLQQIIKETADRLKKKEYQEGENEVAMSKMAGDINLEQRNAELIRIKKSHTITESRIEGQAEAEKVNAFIAQLAGDNNVVSKEKAVELYTMLRKVDCINLMSQGKSTMYVTPNDVNLSVGQLYPSAIHGEGHGV